MIALFTAVRRDERAALAWSFLYFFLLLSGYYVLRPVRDEMGIQAGLHNLPWLFSATFLAMLAAVPAYGWLTARLPRRKLLPAVYGFFILNLLLFYGAFQVEGLRPAVARAFFVWVSVFNLFAVSVFWSFMVDLYREEQGKRLFGIIAAGGTAGAIAGPAITAALAAALGPVALLLVSAALLAGATFCIARLLAGAQRQAGATAAGGAALGGSIWAGLRDVARSPYLLGICFYLVCYTALSTLLYVEMIRLVAEAYPAPQERTLLFARLDLAVNVLALAAQLALTGPVLSRLGITFALALLPAAGIAGFLALGAAPVLAVLVVFGVVRRAGEFALSKPAREILFTLVPREQKYKAKSVIDTVVYRGGDAAASWLAAGLRGLGLTLSGMALVGAGIAACWLLAALWLGRRAARAAPES